MEHQADPVVTIPVHRLQRITDIIFAFSMVLFIISGMLTFNNADFWDGYEADPAGFVTGQARELLTSFLVFLFMAIYWTTHVGQSKYIIRVDTTYIWINIFYLFFISIAPLPNALSLKFGDDIYVQQFFNLDMLLIGIFSYFAWYYATKGHRLVIQHLSGREIRETNWNMLIEPLVALIAILVSLTYPVLWELALLLLPIGMIILTIVLRKSKKKAEKEKPG
ncbi:MAG: DUF1211 domain-containing protein [Bacteroidetes bacterium]|nr:MAG: DUF1211 domain-containing protein [Bacteroidota bacterium]